MLRDNSGRAVGVNISVAKSLGLDALREAMIERALENGGKGSSENCEAE